MLGEIKNNICKLIPDRIYLELKYKSRFGKKINWNNPQSLNEKLQWLKLYDRNPEYTKMVDKYNVKPYVANIIGNEYIIPTLGVWKSFDDIDFDILPNRFVLKCTHDSGGLVICKDKTKFDKESASVKIKKSLKRNFYWIGREWPYKNVHPVVLAEKLLHPNSDETELLDYKILCFNGKPDNIMVCSGRNTGELRYYYFDLEWNFLRYQSIDMDLPNDFTLPKPKHLDLMIDLASKLAKEIPLVRVDFYEAEGQVWFGELTFYPCDGFDMDITRETDLLFGKKLVLPNKKIRGY